MQTGLGFEDALEIVLDVFVLVVEIFVLDVMVLDIMLLDMKVEVELDDELQGCIDVLLVELIMVDRLVDVGGGGGLIVPVPLIDPTYALKL